MSMRVQYTLPGIDNNRAGIDNNRAGIDNNRAGIDNNRAGIDNSGPGIDNSSPSEASSTASAELAVRFGEAGRAEPESWREVLGLNAPQLGDLVLDPPAKPASFSYSDADESRRQWNGLLRRHLSAQAADARQSQMLETLLRLREQEDDLQARILAEPKE